MGREAQRAPAGTPIHYARRRPEQTTLYRLVHCLVLDGVYRPAEGGPVFVEAQAPTAQALQAMLQKIIRRILKLLTRRGCLVEEGGHELSGRFRYRW